MLKAVPPLTARSVFGHAPAGAGMMSAGWFVWARSCRAETLSFTYGLVADPVRWQIDRAWSVPSVRAFALDNATVKAASAAMSNMNRFIHTPPL